MCSTEQTIGMRAVQNRAFVTVPPSASTLGVRIGSLALNLAEVMAGFRSGRPLSNMDFSSISITNSEGTETAQGVASNTGVKVYTTLPYYEDTSLEELCPGSPATRPEEPPPFTPLQRPEEPPPFPPHQRPEETSSPLEDLVSITGPPPSQEQPTVRTPAAADDVGKIAGKGWAKGLLIAMGTILTAILSICCKKHQQQHPNRQVQ